MPQQNFRSCVVDRIGIAEQIVRENLETCFAIRYYDSNDIIEEVSYAAANNVLYSPYPTDHKFFIRAPVAFATRVIPVAERQTEEEIEQRIIAFLREHMDMRELDRLIAARYIFLTYCYDEFEETPYLHILGDLGSGKTKLGKILSHLAYKCVRTSGAATASPIFRTLDYFRGTLWIDEYDFTTENERAQELSTILNIGNSSDTPYLRMGDMSRKTTPYPDVFEVYGPKIVTGRTTFKDLATESRCFRIYLEQTERHHAEAIKKDQTPTGLPRKRFRLHFGSDMKEELMEIRNQLLTWRVLHYGEHGKNIDESMVRPGWSPRTTQLIQVLFAVSQRNELDILTYAEELEDRNRKSRGEEFVTDILDVLVNSPKEELQMGEIAESLNSKLVTGNKFSARRVGGILRSQLHLETKNNKHRNVTTIDLRKNEEKIKKLAYAHGIEFTRYPFDPLPEQQDVFSSPEKLEAFIKSEGML